VNSEIEVCCSKMDDQSKVHDRKVQEHEHDVEHQHAYGETSSLGKDDILQLEHTDPVLNAKMHLVNNAIDEVSLVREDSCAYVLITVPRSVSRRINGRYLMCL